MFLKRIAEQLDRHGTLFLLRHGFKDRDSRFSLCQFRPAHDANPALWKNYAANRLIVVRQLHYSRHNQNSLDLGLFVNGLPVATAKLKTDLTQNIRDAIRQYQKDRLPRDPVAKDNELLLAFKTRASVHFAVFTDKVFITTRLEGAIPGSFPSTRVTTRERGIFRTLTAMPLPTSGRISGNETTGSTF